MAIAQAIRTPPRRHKSGCPTSGRLGRGFPPSLCLCLFFCLSSRRDLLLSLFVLSHHPQTSSFRPEHLAHLRATQKSVSQPMSSLFPRLCYAISVEKGPRKPEG